ncbi:hypothetical protein [Nocardia sp. NPDC024068]|uniref:hypothetical protein n=1 Tax=Nocardia sp. NPDC024068 TaxID=3157197 RepID=UPI0033C8AEA4
MNTEVIPPAERRDMVRRLIALCHIANDLVELAEREPTAAQPVSPALREHARQLRAGLRDSVVDLVANGHAEHPDRGTAA